MRTAFSDQRSALRIIEDRGARGGVIQIPVARTAALDLSKTSGGGDGTLSVDGEMFQQIVANFAAKPGPVPVYFGHDNSAPRRPDTPAAGFVTRVWVEGDQLWNEIDLSPKAWDLIVTQRGFAGASIEAVRDKQSTLGLLSGWSETGLSITNNPALDVQYIAASERNTMATTDPVRLVDQLLAETRGMLREMGVTTFAASSTMADSKPGSNSSDDQLVADFGIVPPKWNGDVVARRRFAGRVAEVIKANPGMSTAWCKSKAEEANYGAAHYARNAMPEPDRSSGSQPGPGQTLNPEDMRRSGWGPNEAKAEQLLMEARKIAAERSIGFQAALDVVKEENPTFYAEGTADVPPVSKRSARQAQQTISVECARRVKAGTAKNFEAALEQIKAESPELHAEAMTLYGGR